MAAKRGKYLSFKNIIFVFAVLSFAIMIFFIAKDNITSGLNNENAENKVVKKQSFLMGTVITQQVYGANGEIAADEVVRRLEEIEKRVTLNSADSEIYMLNEMAGKGTVSLSKDTIYILSVAKKYAELSNGAFDPTVGPLVKAWGISPGSGRIPGDEEIKSLLPLIDFNDLIIDEEKLTARLEKAGQSVDLGGIAKGYAGDEAIRIYREYGIESAYINLGGNVVTLGNKPDGSPWRIGVQNPRDITGNYVGIIEVSNKTVVTSGDYERYFERDGKRYHHIIDPRTGYPSESGLISATIVCDLSIDADALSTSVFVLGLEKGMELVEKLEGVEAILITNDKNIYVSSGLEGKFNFNEKATDFKYVGKYNRQ